MKKLIILGGSGIGMIAAYIADVLGQYEVKGFLNDVLPIQSKIGRCKKIPIVGRTEDIEKYTKEKNYYFFIAYVGLQNEKATYERISKLEIPPERYAKLIHPTAIVPRDYSEVGHGVLCAPLSQLSPDTVISDNCIILGNSFVGHDSFLDRFAHIATNSVVGANVHVGKAVHVGSNATIKEKVKIGDFSLVGAGAVVVKDVPENTIVIGNPARVLKYKD